VAALHYDEIGYWTEVKLDIVRDYAKAYSTILAKQPVIKKYLYIDVFAGPGVHISKHTGELVPGSPLNALHVSPKFHEYHFIDLDGDKAKALGGLVGDRDDVIIYNEDCNEVLLKKIFPHCQYADYRRALCLLDPYSLNVDWKVLQTAGTMRSIEIFYNFMIMDANMNILWRDPQKVPASQAARMDFAWGDASWREVAYHKSKSLFEDIEEKEDNRTIAEAFRKRLEKVAGFLFVPEPLPMRNSKGSIVYYLFFASANETGGNIVSHIFSKYRNRMA